MDDDPKLLSDRIGRTTVVIDGLKARLESEQPTSVIIQLDNMPHRIPKGFSELIMRAVHAVLMQSRAIDAVMLARAAGVPAAVEGADEVTIVVQAPRALPPADGDDDG